MAIPIITTTENEIIIRIPKDAIGEVMRKKAAPISPKREKGVDFRYLIGILKNVPEFKGKTSVEVQHMISDIWASRYSS